MDKKIDYENTRAIVCPYCGYEDKDSWEHQGEDGEDIEMDCGKCEKPFVAIRNITIDYTSYPKEEKTEGE